MKVFIIESSDSEDFFFENLDGVATRGLLTAMGVRNKFRVTLDRKHLSKAIKDSAKGGYTVVHLSCHGGDDGITVTDDEPVSWKELAKIFEDARYTPEALVMSSCKGVAGGIGKAFGAQKYRPKIIFGSLKRLNYSKFCAAWSILYYRFDTDGISQDAAQKAMEQISAVVDSSFLYRRWDDSKKKYRHYPSEGERYTVKRMRTKPS